MSMEFMRETLKRIVATIINSLGFNKSKDDCLNVLSDILHNYLMGMGKRLKLNAENCGRTQPNFYDLLFIFIYDNMDINSLLEYINCVQIPLKDPPLPILPVRRLNRDVIRPKAVVLPSLPNTVTKESSSTFTEPSQDHRKSFPENFKHPEILKNKPTIPIKIDLRAHEIRKKILKTNIENYKKLTEKQMYILRKCIELENRQRKVQFNSLCHKKMAKSLVWKYVDYQTTISNYYRLKAKKKLSRQQKKVSESHLKNVELLVFNDILMQDIDIGLSVTVETSKTTDTKRRIFKPNQRRRKIMNTKRVGDPLNGNSKPNYNQNSKSTQNGNSKPNYNQNSKSTQNENLKPKYKTKNENTKSNCFQNGSSQSKFDLNGNHQGDFNQNGKESNCDKKCLPFKSNFLSKNIAVKERLFRVMSENNLEVTVIPSPKYSDAASDIIQTSTNVSSSDNEYKVIRSGPTSVTLKRHKSFCGSIDKENIDLDDLVSSPPFKRTKI